MVCRKRSKSQAGAHCNERTEEKKSAKVTVCHFWSILKSGVGKS